MDAITLTRVSLRKAIREDARMLVAWRNADRDCFGDTKPLTLPGHVCWWDGVYEQDPWDHLYVAEADGRPAGTIGLKLGDRPEIHRVLLGDKTLARRGVMSAALKLLTGSYGLPRYWLLVKPGNQPAIRFYQRNGFTVTGQENGCLVMQR